MKLYSTNNPKNIVDLKEAVLNALPVDRGLYMPVDLVSLDDQFFKELSTKTFSEIAFEVSSHLFGDYIPEKALTDIVEQAFDWPAPVVGLGNDIYSLELFHGPSLAFKDFGARYMSKLMAYFNQGQEKLLTILVATSGDTGGAVASGFHNTPGIEVIILYPSGKVSPLQEQQLTTWGDNITAVELNGSFDDCQDLVKAAFLDNDLKSKYRLSSANSINIARLIPQSFYYFEAYKQLHLQNKELVVAVPSGNFGNLTAGVLALKMGLNIHKFIAATNANAIVPYYLETGKFEAKESIATISNAMDVGNPSNFPRLAALFGSTWNIIKDHVLGFELDDQATQHAMIDAFNQYGYICDPHGAIGYAAINELKKANQVGLFLETAHPSKFISTVESTLNRSIDIPKRLKDLEQLQKESHILPNDYNSFKNWLINR